MNAVPFRGAWRYKRSARVAFIAGIATLALFGWHGGVAVNLDEYLSATSLVLLEPSRDVHWSTLSTRPEPGVDVWERASEPPQAGQTRWVHGPATLLSVGARIERGLFEPALSLFNGVDEHAEEVPHHAIWAGRVLEVVPAAPDSLWALIEVESATPFSQLETLGLETSDANTWIASLSPARAFTEIGGWVVTTWDAESDLGYECFFERRCGDVILRYVHQWSPRGDGTKTRVLNALCDPVSWAAHLEGAIRQ